jgi:hypothetical protein
VADTVQNVVNDAFAEIGVFGATQTPDTVSCALALRILNREMDAWAALKRYVPATVFTEYTLTPNHYPHLIGPTATAPNFTVAQRPMRVESASLTLNNVTPNVDLELNLRDRAWWAAQSVKTVTTTTPTDLFYRASFPNGELNLWPVPDFAYGLLLETWTLILQFAALTSAFSMPPAWQKAVTLTLAENLCRPFLRPVIPDLVEAAREARRNAQTYKSPRISSADWGTSGSRGGQGSGFNYETGGPSK